MGEPVRYSLGNVVKYIGALTDIHVQKTFSEKLEKLVADRTRELANLNMELQRSNEDLQQFAHVASHDLKEPVRKVRTFNNRLMEEFGDYMPDKAKNYIIKIENAAIE